MRQIIHRTFVETDRYKVHAYKDRVLVSCATCPDDDPDGEPSYISSLDGCTLTTMLGRVSAHEKSMHHARIQ